MRWLRITTSDLAIGLILTVLAWPSTTLDRAHTSGVDGWQSALAMAAHNDIPFGTHVLFTYGPLGFLTVQQFYYTSTAVAAFAFTLAISTAVFGALVRSLRRAVPLPLAVVVTYVVGAVSLHIQLGPEYSLSLALIVCIAALSRPEGRPVPLVIWMGLGAALSVFALVKVSLGAGIVAALIITVAFLPGRRRGAIGGLAIGAVPTFCLCWFGTGNGLGNVIPFARGAAAVIGGYSSAMSIEDPTRLYTYALAALVVVVVVLFARAHRSGLPRRSRVGIAIVTMLVLWLLFKEGFVRHDYDHDLIFFAVAPLVLVAFLPRRRSWILVPGVLILAVVTCVAAEGFPSAVTRPDVALRSFFSEAVTLASPNRSATAIDQARQILRDDYALPPRMVAMMRGHTVDVSPWEQTVAWAYPQVRFDPLPVIADYNAYTSTLDRLDTDYLASPDAPRFILRQPLAIDGRDPAFEPPAVQLSIECSYRQVSGFGKSWQLLEHGTDRCGALQLIDTISTGFEHWVTVPTAPRGYAVVARMQLSEGWLSKVEAVLFKPPEVFVSSTNAQRTWRFITSTGPDLHVLRSASTLGYSTGFAPAPIDGLRFSIQGENQTSTGVRVSFYKIHESAVDDNNGEIAPTLITRIVARANGSTRRP